MKAIGDSASHATGSMEPSNSSSLFRLLVIGLGVCTWVIALLGVDGFCSSNLLDILLVIGLGVETDVIVLVGVDGWSNDGCSYIGLVALLDGTTWISGTTRRHYCDTFLGSFSFWFWRGRWWCIRFINIFIASFSHVPKLFTPFCILWISLQCHLLQLICTFFPLVYQMPFSELEATIWIQGQP